MPKFFKITLLLLLSIIEVIHLNAQIKVIDNKGTLRSVDTSKWEISGTNIFNKNSGSVGIGVTNPLRKFHTSGTLRFEGLATNTTNTNILTTNVNGDVTTRSFANLLSGNAITSLNGLTNSVQTFGIGTSGTDFNINSSGSLHTFNFPNASASNRGLLTSANWTLFNNKIGIVTASTADAVMTTGTTATIQNTLSRWNANQLQGTNVASTAPTNNQTLTYNSTSTQWEPRTNSSWDILGNAGTSPATNFFGTTDNVDLVFRTNNIEKIRLFSLANPSLGIGRSSLAGVNGGASSFSGPTLFLGTAGNFSSSTGFDFIIDDDNNSTNTQFVFKANGDGNTGTVELMQINENGNVGIGITSGTAQAKLHNVGTLRFEGLGTNTINTNILTTDVNGDVTTRSISNLLSGNAISSLNGITTSAQTFGIGTTGSDFTINSSGSTHTFNLPNASALNRGLLTSADWITFNNKIGIINGTAPITASTTSGTTTIGITRNNIVSGASSNVASDPLVLDAGATNAVVGGANATLTVNNTAPLWNANQLQGRNVATTTPTARQLLTWDATTSTWKPDGYTVLTVNLTSYTLSESDHGKILDFTSNAAITLTVPAALTTGFQVSITQAGTGVITFVGSGGMVVNNRWNGTKTAGKWAKAGVEIRATNSAILSGDVL